MRSACSGPKSRPRTASPLDVNSFFLRDIWSERYPSLFGSFYIDMLRGCSRSTARSSFSHLLHDGGRVRLTKFPTATGASGATTPIG